MNRQKLTYLVIALLIGCVFAVGAKMDLRDDNSNKYPVWKVVIDQMTVASGGHAAVTDTFTISGCVRRITIDLSNADNSVTATVALTDEEGAVIYTSGANNENAITILDVTEYMHGTLTVTMDVNSDPGASGITADIVLFGT